MRRAAFQKNKNAIPASAPLSCASCLATGLSSTTAPYFRIRARERYRSMATRTAAPIAKNTSCYLAVVIGVEVPVRHAHAHGRLGIISVPIFAHIQLTDFGFSALGAVGSRRRTHCGG